MMARQKTSPTEFAVNSVSTAVDEMTVDVTLESDFDVDVDFDLWELM